MCHLAIAELFTSMVQLQPSLDPNLGRVTLVLLLNALKTRTVTPNYMGEQLVEGAALNCHSGEKKKSNTPETKPTQHKTKAPLALLIFRAFILFLALSYVCLLLIPVMLNLNGNTMEAHRVINGTERSAGSSWFYLS